MVLNKRLMLIALLLFASMTSFLFFFDSFIEDDSEVKEQKIARLFDETILNKQIYPAKNLLKRKKAHLNQQEFEKWLIEYRFGELVDKLENKVATTIKQKKDIRVAEKDMEQLRQEIIKTLKQGNYPQDQLSDMIKIVKNDTSMVKSLARREKINKEIKTTQGLSYKKIIQQGLKTGEIKIFDERLNERIKLYANKLDS